MLDIATLTALASSAVAVLTPLLTKAAEKGAEELGKSTAGALFDKLKQRLKHVGAKEALADLAERPNDLAAQEALNSLLRKSLAEDPELAAFLDRWVTESKSATGVSQTTAVTGNDNKATQIVGSGNSVS
jgi:hypothetical protein